MIFDRFHFNKKKITKSLTIEKQIEQQGGNLELTIIIDYFDIRKSKYIKKLHQKHIMYMLRCESCKITNDMK